MKKKKKDIVITTIQLKRGTAVDLWEQNPFLLDGEPCFEIDTGKIKIGYGAKRWNDLPYINTGTASDSNIIFATDKEFGMMIDEVFGKEPEKEKTDTQDIADDEEIDEMVSDVFGDL